MSQQTVNIGTTANDGTGDQLRDAFNKLNLNFDEVYGGLVPVARSYTPATSVGATGDLAGQVAFDSTHIYVCIADYDGVSNIWISYDIADATTLSTHVADSTIHFTQAAISITESQISDLQSYALAFGVITDATGTRTLALTDAYNLIQLSNATANAVTIPLNASVAFPIGTVIELTRYDAVGTVTVAGDVGVTVNSKSGTTPSITAQHGVAKLIKVAADEWNVSGDI